MCVCVLKFPGRRWTALWGAESPGDQQDIWAQRKPRGLRCHLWPPQHNVQHGLHSDSGELQRPLQPADDELHQGDGLEEQILFIYFLNPAARMYPCGSIQSAALAVLMTSHHVPKSQSISCEIKHQTPVRNVPWLCFMTHTQYCMKCVQNDWWFLHIIIFSKWREISFNQMKESEGWWLPNYCVCFKVNVLPAGLFGEVQLTYVDNIIISLPLLV